MSKFVEFENTSGTRRFVNINNINQIIEFGCGCTVYISKDDFFKTIKSYDEVVAIIKQELRENE